MTAEQMLKLINEENEKRVEGDAYRWLSNRMKTAPYKRQEAAKR